MPSDLSRKPGVHGGVEDLEAPPRGDLISLYPYIVPARYYYQQRIARMSEYYEQAKELAALFNSCHKVSTLPEVPVSNMFHIHFALPREQLAPVLIGIYNETGIGLTPRLKPTGENACYYELNIGDVYGGVSGAALRKRSGCWMSG